MSTFGKRPGAPEKRPAPAVVEMPASAWADTWAGKPAVAVKVGLRLIADGDIEDARETAARAAWRRHPEPRDEDARVESYNDALIRWVVGRAACRPDDVSRAFWPMPEDEIPAQLTTAGVRLLYDRYEALKLETSPLGEEAGAEDLGRLGAILADPSLCAALAEELPRRDRRMLRICLDHIRASFGLTDPSEN